MVAKVEKNEGGVATLSGPKGTRQFVTFYLNGHLFGVDVVHVQEVIREQAMTRVPLAPLVVSGLINLRGQIVLAIDLRRRLGLAQRAGDASVMNLVAHTGDGPVSLLVDEIGEVIEVGADVFENSPDTLKGVHRELVEGVYKLKSQLLIALNVNRVIQIGEA